MWAGRACVVKRETAMEEMNISYRDQSHRTHISGPEWCSPSRETWENAIKHSVLSWTNSHEICKWIKRKLKRLVIVRITIRPPGGATVPDQSFWTLAVITIETGPGSGCLLSRVILESICLLSPSSTCLSDKAHTVVCREACSHGLKPLNSIYSAVSSLDEPFSRSTSDGK